MLSSSDSILPGALPEMFGLFSLESARTIGLSRPFYTDLQNSCDSNSLAFSIFMPLDVLATAFVARLQKVRFVMYSRDD
jgi:hypothetical protein